jgi:hypothetical protein
MRQSFDTSRPINNTVAKTLTEVSINQVQLALKDLIDLAWNNANTLADAQKLQANLAQMVTEWRTTVQQWVLALIHAQKQLIIAENAWFSTTVSRIFTDTPPATNNERFAIAA